MQFIRTPKTGAFDIKQLLPGLMGMSILFGTTSMLAVIITFLLFFFVDLNRINLGVGIVSVLLMAITSTLLGLAIAVSSREVFEAQTYSNFFRFPMLFLSGLFIPIKELPVFLQPISYCLPLTYGVDMLNRAILHTSIMNIWFDFTMVIIFSVLLFYFCQRNIKRKWIL